MRKLIVEPSYGLGNRLLALTAAMQAAEVTDRHLVVSWDASHKACACPLDMLFNNSFEAGAHQDVLNADKIVDFLRKPRPTRRIIPSGIDPKTLAVCACSTFWVPGHRPRIKAYLDKLILNQKVQRTIDLWRFTIEDLSERIGIHMRMTDHREAMKISPIGKFVRDMSRMPGDTKFLVCSDNPQAIEEVLSEFPGRAVSVTHESYNRKDAEAIQSALVDIVLLSKTRRIHGSAASTFSQVAALWGGIPLVRVR